MFLQMVQVTALSQERHWLTSARGRAVLQDRQVPFGELVEDGKCIGIIGHTVVVDDGEVGVTSVANCLE